MRPAFMNDLFGYFQIGLFVFGGMILLIFLLSLWGAFIKGR